MQVVNDCSWNVERMGRLMRKSGSISNPHHAQDRYLYLSQSVDAAICRSALSRVPTFMTAFIPDESCE